MVHFRTLDVRWAWRYRTIFIICILIMSLQIFLAVIFFTLYDETDRNSSSDTYLKNSALFNQVRIDSMFNSKPPILFSNSNFACRKKITNTMTYHRTKMRSQTNQKTPICLETTITNLVPYWIKNPPWKATVYQLRATSLVENLFLRLVELKHRFVNNSYSIRPACYEMDNFIRKVYHIRALQMVMNEWLASSTKYHRITTANSYIIP